MKKNLRGFSVLEIVLSAGIFAVFSFAFVVSVLQGSSVTQTGLRAESGRQWAIEGIEAMRSIRNQSFEGLQNTSGSGIRFENEKWKFFGTEDEWEGFRRVVTVEAARRDADGNIVTSGGEEAEDLKLVTSTVTKDNFEVEFSAYLSRREIIITP